MLDRPDIWKIITSDPRVLSIISPILFISAITGISFFSQDSPFETGVDVAVALRVLAVFFVILAVVIWYRVRKINQVFDSGVEVMAEIVRIKTFRSNMSLFLKYEYQGQTFETKYDQTITGKTKAISKQKQLILVVDREDPKNFLPRDVYR